MDAAPLRPAGTKGPRAAGLDAIRTDQQSQVEGGRPGDLSASPRFHSLSGVESRVPDVVERSLGWWSGVDTPSGLAAEDGPMCIGVNYERRVMTVRMPPAGAPCNEAPTGLGAAGISSQPRAMRIVVCLDNDLHSRPTDCRVLCAAQSGGRYGELRSISHRAHPLGEA